MKWGKLMFKTSSADETIKFGEKLGRLLAAGHVIALVGELGAGKTTLVKGIVQGLGVKDRRAVKSPTFSLIHKYEGRVSSPDAIPDHMHHNGRAVIFDDHHLKPVV